MTMNGFTSALFPASYVVLQGSHLDPLFFNVFINDIGDCFSSSNYYLLAYDLKLFRSIDGQLNSISLQEDLSRLNTWRKANNIMYESQSFEVFLDFCSP